MFIRSKWDNLLYNMLCKKGNLSEVDWHIYDLFWRQPEWTLPELQSTTDFSYQIIESTLDKLIEEKLINKLDSLYYNSEFYSTVEEDN